MDLFILSGFFFPPHIIYIPLERLVTYYERILKTVAFIII